MVLWSSACSSAFSQVNAGNPDLHFEAAVIKPSPPETGSPNRMIKPLPGADGYMARNFPVRLMIALMYRVPVRQIEGGPSWLDDAYYDIDARADHSYSKDQLQAMFRAMLAERFGLRMHTTSRNGKLFALRVDGSVKMKLNPDGPGMNIPITPVGYDSFVGRGVSMTYFSWFLGQQLQDQQRPVVDYTALTGTYDFTLSYAPDSLASGNTDGLPAEIRDRPSLANALREQLGLKLVPEDGPVQYFIIDHVERPSAN